MAVSKKAFLFSILSAIVLVSFYVFMSGRYAVDTSDQLIDINAPLAQSTQAIRDLSDFQLNRIVASSTYQTLNQIAAYYNESHPQFTEYFENEREFYNSFQEMLLNGTLDEVELDELEDVAIRNKLDDLFEKVDQELNIKVEYRIEEDSLALFQEDPWNVTVVLVISYTITDGDISFERNRVNIREKVSIEGLKDPYLALQGISVLTRIQRGPVFEEWNISNLKTVYANHSRTYFTYRGAPSYLQRFMGDTTPNSNGFGIEAIYQPLQLGIQGDLDIKQGLVLSQIIRPFGLDIAKTISEKFTFVSQSTEQHLRGLDLPIDSIGGRSKYTPLIGHVFYSESTVCFTNDDPADEAYIYRYNTSFENSVFNVEFTLDRDRWLHYTGRSIPQGNDLLSDLYPREFIVSCSPP